MTRHDLGRNVVFGAGACGGKWVMAKVTVEECGWCWCWRYLDMIEPKIQPVTQEVEIGYIVGIHDDPYSTGNIYILLNYRLPTQNEWFPYS